MAVSFNADEIFEMAEEIERNGAKFYRKAAQETSDEKIKKMFLDMAEMEDGHLRTFEQMRTQLSEGQKEQNIFDPNNEGAMYLQTMADAHGYEGRISPQKEFTGNESVKEILEIALNAEKESVVFYYGIRSMVSMKAGRSQVELIINEELSHITTLLKYLKKLN